MLNLEAMKSVLIFRNILKNFQNLNSMFPWNLWICLGVYHHEL